MMIDIVRYYGQFHGKSPIICDNLSQDYAYVQIHHLVDGKYRIENALLKLDKESVTEIDMHSIRGFENVPKTVETGSDKRLFVIDRLNIVNNYDNTLPLGIAVYANAIDQLKACDIAYDSYVNEFVLGKKRIMVKPEAVKNIDGNPYFDPNDVTFYVLPEDSDPSSIIHETNMEIRAAAHNAGQLAAACAVTGNAAVMYYLPALLISGIVTGLFTGMCTYYILKNKYVKRICAALAEDR